MNEKIHIGTSGWHYSHWKGPFYPQGVADKDMLDYYQQFFSTAEINNTFYQLPEATTLDRWAESVGGSFLFSVKASRYITHMKKLLDPREPVANFLGRVRNLGHKLGPVLFQLPPNWKANPGRLSAFLSVLPEDLRYVFEFRDPSWFVDEVYRELEKKQTAFCIYDLAGTQSPLEITADFVYLRLHGPGDAYQGQYDESTLREWARRLERWVQEGKEVFCYFDNDQSGYAPQDAMRLKRKVGQE